MAVDSGERIALPAVFVGVLAVGAAAIFIRLADAPAAGIALWRCALGVIALLPLAAWRRERLPEGRDLWVGAVAGVALGAHFGTWIASLDYTSVAASVVLVSTTPVFVAVAAYLLLGERTSVCLLRRNSARDRGHGGHRGRRAGHGQRGVPRQRPGPDGGRGDGGLRPDRTFPSDGRRRCARLLYRRLLRRRPRALPVALLSGAQLWGYSATTWFWLFVITLGPQLLGHTVLNWALEYVRAPIVSGAVLAEPVIAALLAWLVLAEKPGLAPCSVASSSSPACTS